MASTPLSPNSAEYAWAKSVVESVEMLTARRARWDGSVSMTDDVAAARIRPDHLRSKQTEGIYLTYEQYAQISQAIARRNDRAEGISPNSGTAEERQADWDAVISATGAVAVQTGELIGPRPLRPDRPVEGDAELGEGLAAVIVEENLTMIVVGTDSNQLLLRDGTPDPHFAYSGGPAATTTRDVISQLAYQQQGRDPDSPELSQLSYQMLRQPPDVRFQSFDAVIGSVPGTDLLHDDVRRDLTDTFRSDFHRVVQEGNPGAGSGFSPASNAVRQLASRTVQSIEAARAAQANARTGPPSPGEDPALVSARLATTNPAGSPAPKGSPATGEQVANNRPKPRGIGD